MNGKRIMGFADYLHLKAAKPQPVQFEELPEPKCEATVGVPPQAKADAAELISRYRDYLRRRNEERPVEKMMKVVDAELSARRVYRRYVSGWSDAASMRAGAAYLAELGRRNERAR
jgi:hypothetical protein